MQHFTKAYLYKVPWELRKAKNGGKFKKLLQGDKNQMGLNSLYEFPKQEEESGLPGRGKGMCKGSEADKIW